jgi:hypothetical protein
MASVENRSTEPKTRMSWACPFNICFARFHAESAPEPEPYPELLSGYATVGPPLARKARISRVAGLLAELGLPALAETITEPTTPTFRARTRQGGLGPAFRIPDQGNSMIQAPRYPTWKPAAFPAARYLAEQLTSSRCRISVVLGFFDAGDEVMQRLRPGAYGQPGEEHVDRADELAARPLFSYRFY